MFETADEVLHHDDRGVHEQPEIERSEAHEIRRDAELLHRQGGEEQRQRNDGRHDERRADVAKEEQQHERHEQAALSEVGEDGARGLVDDGALAVERADRHAGGQQWLDVRQASLDASNDLSAVGPFEHDDLARERFATAVARHGAFARHGADGHRGDVAYEDRRAVCSRLEHDAGDVGLVRDTADAPNREALAASFDVPGAEVAVVRGQRAGDIVKASAHTRSDDSDRCRHGTAAPCRPRC